MNNEELEEGISLGELFAIVWARKIIIGSITILLTIVAVAVVIFSVNPKSVVYQSTFELSFPGIEENKYPSGYRFNYKDIIEDSAVQLVIDNSAGKLDYLDVDSFDNNTLNILEQSATTTTQEGVIIVPDVREFLITVEGRMFNSKEDAAYLVEELVNNVINDVLYDVENLSHYIFLNNSNKSDSFEMELSLLDYQVSYIANNYTALIDEFGDVTVNINQLETTLLGYQTEFITSNLANRVGSLINQLNTGNNGAYYFKNNSADYLYTRQSALASQVLELTNTITALGALNDNQGAGSIIANLIVEKATLETELTIVTAKIDAYEYTVNDGSTYPHRLDSETFEEQISDVVKELKEYTDTYVDVITTLYDDFTFVRFDYREVVDATGGVSIVLVAMASCVFVGGVSSVAFIALDLNKKDKKEVKTN